MGLEAPALSSGTDYHGLQGPNQWPADWPEFQQASETYLRELHTVGETLMRTLALSLNLEEDTFSRHFNPPYCMLRLIAYPPVTRESGSRQGIGEHTDFGCLTLLAQESSAQQRKQQPKSTPPVSSSWHSAFDSKDCCAKVSGLCALCSLMCTLAYHPIVPRNCRMMKVVLACIAVGVAGKMV